MNLVMSRRLGRSRMAVVVVLVMLVAVVLASPAPRAAADSPQTAVIDWNKHTFDALGNATTAPTPGAGLTTPVLSVHLPIVQGAVYDAVNAIDGGHQPYLGDLPPAPASASKAAAAATAARDTLVALLNQIPLSATYTAEIRQAILDRLNGPLPDGLYASSIAAATIADGAPAVAAGIAAGQAAAAAMLAERANDGRFGSFRFTCGEDAGQWRPISATTCTTPSGPSDPFAWVAKVQPFVVESNTQFQSKGPRELTSGAYAKEYNEVKSLGAVGSQRTAEQQALVDFFQPNPVEMFTRSFRGIAVTEELDLAEQARLFAKLAFAGGDAFITCWEDKAHWSFWRPQTAIRLGDDDGNPKTDDDTGWTSAIGTPPYPDHSSGYNCATGSLTAIAESYFGQGPTTFTISHLTAPPGSPPGTPPLSRTYQHFRDVCNDTIDARIYQGIHFRSADEQGVEIGRDVARWVDKHALLAAT
jgi:hypothetical protein